LKESSLLAIGRIRTSHGVRGEVKVTSYSGEYEHFTAMTSLIARKDRVEKVLDIEAHRWAGEQLLLKFKGYDQPEQAKTLADFELWAPRDQAAPLGDNEVYLSDLVGCRLIYGGVALGEVTGYLEGGSSELLEVRKNDGSVSIVPYADVYLGNTDVVNKTIELKVDWILE